MKGFQLSPQQKRLWHLQQAEARPADGAATRTPYWSQAVLELSARPDPARLEAALARLVSRHELLRTSFASLPGMGLPLQIIGAQGAQPLLRWHQLEGQSRGLARRAVERALSEVQQAEVEWRQGATLQVTVIGPVGSDTGRNGQWWMTLSLPSMYADGRGMSNLGRGLAWCYGREVEGSGGPPEPEVIQYADLAEWQNELFEAAETEGGRAYWAEQTVGDSVEQWTCWSEQYLSRESRQAGESKEGGGFRPALARIPLSGAHRRRVEAAAEAAGVGVSEWVLTCWALLWSRLSGQPELAIGTSFNGRRYEGLSQAPGLLVKYLPLHVGVAAGATLAEAAHSVAVKSAELRKWQEYYAAEEEREQAYAGVCYSYAEQGWSGVYGGLSWTSQWEYECAQTYRLKLVCEAEAGGRLGNLWLHYDATIATREVLELGEHLRTLLADSARVPERPASRLAVLSTRQRRRLLEEVSREPKVEAHDCHTLHEMFERQAARTPQAPAVVCDDQRLTYAELDARANQLARRLRLLGVGPESRVGLLLERSAPMVVAILGVLKAGAAYVPLDAGSPDERLRYLAHDAALVVLTQEGWAHRAAGLGAQLVLCMPASDEHAGSGAAAHETGTASVQPVTSAVSGDNLCYVIYTSGSTGRPKGVMVTHRQLLHYVAAVRVRLRLRDGMRYALLTTFAADLGHTVIFPSMCTGGCLHLPPEEAGADAALLAAYVGEHDIECVKAVPSQLSALLLGGGGRLVLPRTHLVVGGEVLSGELVRRVAKAARERASEAVGERAPEAAFTLYNHYGPTETTVGATAGAVWEAGDEWVEAASTVGAGGTSAPMGRALGGASVYVLDGWGEVSPQGVPGELYIGGDGVARGYLARPALTAERFVPDPYSLTPGARLYRTEDRARYRPDGQLEFLGRMDHQVKVRGYRIELGEVEAALRALMGVREAVVEARGTDAEKRLVAYIVWDEAVVGTQRAVAEVRERLRERLPEYMVPSVYVEIERMPLTANGKVDRRALPEVEQRGGSGREDEAGRTGVEELLCGIWEEVLGVEQVGVHDNFFELGGHSLLATQVVSRVNSAFGVEIPVSSLFNALTIGELAKIVESEIRAGEGVLPPPIVAARRERELPLSFAQQRLWFLNQIEPHSAFYNNPMRVRVEGLLDVFALKRTLQEVLRRHETLRTTFRLQRGRAVQVISKPRPLGLPMIDLSALPIAEREDEFRWLAREEARRPFDLAEGPLFRSLLLRLDEEEHVALLTIHHIVSDGWSRGVLIREVAALYEAYARGEESPLPELVIQYADYAAWQREWMTGEVLDASLVYWRRQLGPALPVLELPTDHRRPPVQSYRGARELFVLSRQLTERLEELSRREGCTLFMVLLAGFQVLLSRYSGQEDIIVGTPIAGRTRTELEPLIGFFVNMLSLRTDLSNDPSFKELLRRVREMTLGAYAHQELPFDKLVEELQPTRDMGRAPLFQVVFALQNAPQVALELPGLKLSEVEAEGETAKFDLTLTLTGGDQGMQGSAEFNTDLFEAETIRRMLAHFKVLLTHLSLEPEAPVSQAELLTAEEKKRLLVEWNETRSEYERGKCIPELFEDQVERTPMALAVADSAEQLSYRELNHRANRLAHRLRNLGVGPETVVGVFLKRTALRIVGMLGILKAGGAYLPLEPSSPPERVAFMLADARVSVMLTHRDFSDDLLPEGVRAVCLTEEDEAPVAGADENPESGVRSANLAYVIYTSGSTGTPKGVAVSHASLHNLVVWHGRACALTPADRGAHMVAFTFDVSVLEVWPYLCSGTSLHIPEEENLSSPARILDWLSAKGVTICFLATPLAEAVLALPAPPKLSLRKLLTGGDKLTRRPRKDQGYDLVDHYGPAEGTVVTTSAEISSGDEMGAFPDIGRPISNTQVYVLDKNLNPVAPGVTGELYAGGENLARGYMEQPVSTAEKYLPNPFGREPGARLYRTGDLARYLPDGRLEFLGRADRQVKIRGGRVEPGEIECVLARHAAVREAVVIIRRDAAGGNSLVCYLVAKHDRRPPTADELRDFLWGKLPEFMIPVEFNTLDALPLSPNGKLDRSALGGLAAKPQTEYVAPAEGLEQTVAGIWRDVLGVEKVGVYDKFFELGGHSLALMQVKDRLRGELGRDIPIADLFSHPTINSLSTFLGRDEAVEAPTAGRHERTRRRDEALERRKRLVREGGTADD